MARAVQAAGEPVHQGERRPHSVRRPPSGLDVAMSPDALVLPPACLVTLPAVFEAELSWLTAAVPLERPVADHAPVTGAAPQSAMSGAAVGATAAGAARPIRRSERLRGIPPGDHAADGGSDDEASTGASTRGAARQAGSATRCRRPSRPCK